MKQIAIISASLIGALALFGILYKLTRKAKSSDTSEFETLDPFTTT